MVKFNNKIIFLFLFFKTYIDLFFPGTYRQYIYINFFVTFWVIKVFSIKKAFNGFFLVENKTLFSYWTVLSTPVWQYVWNFCLFDYLFKYCGQIFFPRVYVVQRLYCNSVFFFLIYVKIYEVYVKRSLKFSFMNFVILCSSSIKATEGIKNNYRNSGSIIIGSYILSTSFLWI